MFAGPTTLFCTLSRPRAALLAGALLLSTLIIYLFLADEEYSIYPLDGIDLTIHLPQMPSVFRPSSSPAWNRPDMPQYCSPGSPADFWSRKYSEENLEVSRAYGSSGTRFRRLVEKAILGEPIKMGVLGGSAGGVFLPVSGGRNSDPGGPYHSHIFRMWNDTFFPHPNNTIVNGAKGATGSKYFSMCWAQQIPEDVDLVLVETSINDHRTRESANAWETLVRVLLELPSGVAVISLSTFGLAFVEGLRNAMLPYLFDNPTREADLFGGSYGVDRKHMNTLGHEILADFTTHWMKEQICKVLSKTDAPPNPSHAVDRSWWNAPIDRGEVPRRSADLEFKERNASVENNGDNEDNGR
ncbi:hypothetical protein CALVIDRAFT_558481 [Calocera viscosa TUFC12733]|uniref:SGNH hydrolase-type esterase domain-containing protein n=1 Tax=Calocera viscosa (strain TUFC12733) TaxID=1330018 RepID=A0A167GQ15_CALVF|nr:hypothetical protein CALVIDRAFT_558481 [Calocera viscosa TUFC12733]